MLKLTIPPLADDHKFYTIPKVLAILSPYDNNIRLTNCALAIKLLIKSGKLRDEKSTIYHHINSNKRGLNLNDTEFRLSPGRPWLLEHNSVQEINRKIKEYDGKTYGQDDVRKMMIAKLNAKVVEQGKVPLTPIGPSYMSV